MKTFMAILRVTVELASRLLLVSVLAVIITAFLLAMLFGAASCGGGSKACKLSVAPSSDGAGGGERCEPSKR